MEHQEIGLMEALFGNHSSGGEYIAFIIFTIISMALIKMVRYNKKQKSLLRKDPPVYIKFNWNTWRRDNLLDFVTAFISAFILFRFLPQFGVGISKVLNIPEVMGKMAYGVILGLGFQYIWHKILNKVEVVVKKQ